MVESFAELFEASPASKQMRSGDIVSGIIVALDSSFVVVNVGLKSEAPIPREQFEGEELEVGQAIDVAVEAVDDGYGETRLSREKARRMEAWRRLEVAFQAGEIVTGFISGKVKGGFTVEIDGVRAFLPGSLVDVKPVRDTSFLEGKDIELKVIKMDHKRNNIVVSRRSVVESESTADREALLQGLQEGQEMTGVVKNLTDYGAFVDLGGIDGLLHITDMSWKRVKNPNEIVTVGDSLKVKILKIDQERGRVSLGLKQLSDDPWANLARRYPTGSRLFGRVTNLTDYGCFIEIEDGIEGLVHVSEMDWTNKNIHPSKVVQIGSEVEVMVLEVDEERRRISLGIKQCQINPWKAFSENHQSGDRIAGKIKSITDFGIFIGLDGGIDGLVHLSDIAWNLPGDQAIRNYKKGQDVETVVLSIDPDRERISLGIKQLEDDPFSRFVDENTKGSFVTGTIMAIESKNIKVDLGSEIEGSIRVADIPKEMSDDLEAHFKVGDEIKARCVGVDKKDRVINLSMKPASGEEQTAERVERATGSQQKDRVKIGGTLGDLLKDKMENSSEK